MSDAEAQFAAENGMTPQDAWNYILRWREEGRIEQVRRGCEELLKFFPGHEEAHQILEEINHPQVQPQNEDGGGDFAGADEIVPPTKKPGMMDSLLGKFQATVQEQHHKLQEMNPPQSQTAKQSGSAQGLPGLTQPDDSEKLMAAACYLYIFVIIPLLLKRDSQYVQFHAWQGVVLTAGSIGVGMLLKIVTSPFYMGGGSGLGVLTALETLLRLVVVIVYLWGMYSAYSGKWLRIPVVYPFAEKFRRAVK